MFDVEVFDPATNKDVSFSNIMNDSADARQTPHQRLHDPPSEEQSDLHAIEERPPPARTASNAAGSTHDTASLPTMGGSNDLAAQWQSAVDDSHGKV